MMRLKNDGMPLSAKEKVSGMFAFSFNSNKVDHTATRLSLLQNREPATVTRQSIGPSSTRTIPGAREPAKL